MNDWKLFVRKAAGAMVFVGLVLMGIEVSKYLAAPQIESLAEVQKMATVLGAQPSPVPVILFRTSWCGYCEALEKSLHADGISFVSADIEKNQQARTFYRKINKGRSVGVPQTIVGTEVVLGYAPFRVKQALRAALSS